MQPGSTLTTEQARELDALRERWLHAVFSTRPANRKKAEDGVRRTYRAAGVKEPELFLWFDGLLEAALAADQLGPGPDVNRMMPPEALRHRKRVQADLRRRLGLRTWRQVVRAIGPEHTHNSNEPREFVVPLGATKRSCRMFVAVPRADSLQAGLTTWGSSDLAAIYGCPPLAALIRELNRAAWNFRQQQCELFAGHMGPGPSGHSSLNFIFSVFGNDYPFGFLAVQDFLLTVCHEKASAAYAGLCATAHNCSAWWAFANAAILADRPRELNFDREGVLHNADGPAIVYRSGLALHALHGAFRPPADCYNAPSVTD